MALLARKAAELAESGFIADSFIRVGIRRLVEQRRRNITAAGSNHDVSIDRFVEMMNASEIALVPDVANEQHYEVPADFFVECLGKHRKYSCCYWSENTRSLDDAERAALEITCTRAQIADGMHILDLGCGWGSLSLWVATQYPNCSVTSVSNSASQREFIESRAEALGLTNIRVITADMNEFDIDDKFDRVVSIEMFEHMRNYGKLFERISNWLMADGLFFMHIFCHRSAAYEFVDAGPSDWMSRHFFSGGIMPSEDLPLRFSKHLCIEQRWFWGGEHYQKTAEAWLSNMDSRKAAVMRILQDVYGSDNSKKWWMRWRMFFLAVSEMFGSHDGREWHVGHYLFRVKPGLKQLSS